MSNINNNNSNINNDTSKKTKTVHHIKPPQTNRFDQFVMRFVNIISTAFGLVTGVHILALPDITEPLITLIILLLVTYLCVDKLEKYTRNTDRRSSYTEPLRFLTLLSSVVEGYFMYIIATIAYKKVTSIITIEHWSTQILVLPLSIIVIVLIIVVYIERIVYTNDPPYETTLINKCRKSQLDKEYTNTDIHHSLVTNEVIVEESIQESMNQTLEHTVFNHSNEH